MGIEGGQSLQRVQGNAALFGEVDEGVLIEPAVALLELEQLADQRRSRRGQGCLLPETAKSTPWLGALLYGAGMQGRSGAPTDSERFP